MCSPAVRRAAPSADGVLGARLRAALPHPRLFVMYGQTEATSRLTWLPPERLEDKLSRCGAEIERLAG